MYQSVLYKFLQNNLWNLQFTFTVEGLSILRSAQTGFQPTHRVFVHFGDGPRNVAAVAILCAANMVAHKPNGLDTMLWTKQLWFFGKIHQSSNGQTPKFICDVRILQHRFGWHIELVNPLAKSLGKVGIESLGVNIILTTAINAFLIHLILTRLLQKPTDFDIFCNTSLVGTLLHPNVSRQIFIRLEFASFHVCKQISPTFMFQRFRFNIDDRPHMVIGRIAQFTRGVL